MRQCSRRLVNALDISSAIDAEADSVRNLLPQEPGWSILKTEKSSLTSYIVELLLAGFNPSRAVDVYARKPGLGARPVPIVGPIERIVYRALAEVAMVPFEKPDRSAESYVKFVLAPVERADEIEASRSSKPRFGWSLGDTPFKYVIKTDLVSFYQYVDHGILYQELIDHGADSEAAKLLTEFLFGLQGTTYGVPQLLDASDWLSEVYAARLERNLRREGLEVWRFNDDFRIACATYDETLAAIETMSRSARLLGLSLNEAKTSSPRYWRYATSILGAEVTGGAGHFQVEDMVGDYTDAFLENTETAIKALKSTVIEDQPKGDEDEAEKIDLRTVSPDEVRYLRRALNALAHNAEPGASDELTRLIAYVPSLTPSICEYIKTLSQANSADVERVLVGMIREVSLSDWQRLWILSTVGTSASVLANAEVLEWVKDTNTKTTSNTVRVACLRVLADAGETSLKLLLQTIGDLEDALVLHVGDACLRTYSKSNEADRRRLLEAWSEDTKLRRLVCKTALAGGE